jgi:tetratricopeptide (TPR) repeat protein
MSSERIEAMKQFADQFPDNPFPRYALALEYKNSGAEEEAVAAFNQLTTRLPDYVPAYLQFGMLLEKLGRIDEARDVLTRGIEKARDAGNSHALGEMQGVLAGLD